LHPSELKQAGDMLQKRQEQERPSATLALLRLQNSRLEPVGESRSLRAKLQR
jgi:hypothetical protein